MYYGYSQKQNQIVTFFRYPPDPDPKDTRGLIMAGGPQKKSYPGSIQPIRDLRNIRKIFGEEITSAIRYFSAPENKLQIEDFSRLETDESGVVVRDDDGVAKLARLRADVIFHNNQFWRVVSTVVHRLLLPSTQSEAALMTHVPDELLEAV